MTKSKYIVKVAIMAKKKNTTISKEKKVANYRKAREGLKKQRKISADLRIGNHTIKDMRWSDLLKDFREVRESALFYLHLLQNVQTENMETIKSNPLLAKMFKGFSLSLADLVEKITKTKARHLIDAEDGKIKSVKNGPVIEDEDVMTYISIKNQYMAYMEAIANLSVVFFTDILSKVKTTNNIQNMRKVSENLIDNVVRNPEEIREHINKGEAYKVEVED